MSPAARILERVDDRAKLHSISFLFVKESLFKVLVIHHNVFPSCLWKNRCVKPRQSTATAASEHPAPGLGYFLSNREVMLIGLQQGQAYGG